MPADFIYDGSKIVTANGTSGTPKTFANMHDADMAGTLELLAAWNPNNNTKVLGTQVQPAESKGLLVDFVVANKTADADFIFITGTNIDGGAQTESLDVTAGNGTYTTTKWFATITNTDCSDNAAGSGAVWADGDVTVNQNRWGVVWEIAENGQYKIDCDIDFGDGATSTYFQSIYELVYFADGKVPVIKDYATLEIGDASGDWSWKGSCWSMSLEANYFMIENESTNAVFKTYGSMIIRRDAGDRYIQSFRSGTWIARNLIYSGVGLEWNIGSKLRIFSPFTLDWKNVRLLYLISFTCYVSPENFEDVHIHDTLYGLEFYVTGTIPKLNVTDAGYFQVLQSASSAQTLTLKDPLFHPITSKVNIIYTDSVVVEQYTCNIHVADKDGNDLAGVTVLCEDEAGNEVFSVETDVNGDITEQTIDYKKWEGIDEILTEYTPHKFTFSHADYPDFVMNDIIVDHPLVWEFDMGQSTSDLTTIAETAIDNKINLTAGVVDEVTLLSSGVNVTQISGDGVAADNLESQYDGSGLLGDPYPLRQDQGAGIAGGLATRITMASVTVIQGSEQDIANMATSDDNRWTGDDDGSGAEFIFRCTPTNTKDIPIDLHFEGYYDEPTGATNGATLQVYNFNTASWNTTQVFNKASIDEIHDIPLSHGHKAPGSGTLETVAYTIGDVLIKFKQDTNETGNAVLLIDYMTVGFVGSLITAAAIRTELETNGGKLDHLWEMTEDDEGTRRLTENALETAPTAEMDAAEFQTALLAVVGVTEGGTMTLQKLLKIQAAWIAGNWKDKSDSDTVKELLDADDGATVILEMTLSTSTPQRVITIKI